MIDRIYHCHACKNPLSFGVAYCPLCGQKQDTGPSPSWLGERRLVTTIFADLASFTATSEKTDPEDVIDMLNQVFTRLMVECDKEGGYLDKTVGDQLMVLFGVPRTHEDDPVRAVRAALNMQAAMVELEPIMREKVGNVCKLNIGINTGVVVWGRVGPTGRAASTVIGDAVNLACRLEQFATDGQIVVSESVYLLTYRFFDYKSLEPIRVKGKSHPLPVYIPLQPRQSVRSHQQANEIKTPFVERDLELQALHAHWSLAFSNQIQFVLIAGAAGLGKSRLVAEFMSGLETHGADKYALILQSCGDNSSGGHYSPLVDLLSQLFGLTSIDTELSRRSKIEDRAKILNIKDKRFLPLIGYLLGWYQGDDRLSYYEHEIGRLRNSAFEAAATVFFKQATQRPVLLIIDDLQWADNYTLQWLQALADIKQKMQSEYIEHTLLLILISRSQVDLPVESLAIDNVLSLSPLDQIGRYELISHLLPGRNLPEALTKRLSQESGGNPFYLEEAARGLIESGQLIRKEGAWELTRPIQQIVIPPSIEGLVMANLDALNQSARTVIQHASVIGLRFDYELLLAITPIEDLEVILLDLERRGFIKATPQEDGKRAFMFTEILVHEVAYRSLLRRTRRELHERIAHLTEKERNADSSEIEALARHYAAGGDKEKKLVYNWLAGHQAFEQFNFAEACRYLEIAWETLQKMVKPKVELYQNIANALGDASTYTGNFNLAIDCYEALIRLAGEDLQELAILNHKMARLHLYQLNIDKANEYYQQALELSLNNSPLLAKIDSEIRLLYDIG